MAGMLGVQVTGLDTLRSRLGAVDAAISGPAVRAALEAAAMPIQNAAKTSAPVLTGNLRRSIHTEEIDAQSVAVGTDVAYARRLEYGFVGRDSLGRVYNQPPRPYMRPAFDSQRNAAVSAARSVLETIINRAAQS